MWSYAEIPLLMCVLIISLSSVFEIQIPDLGVKQIFNLFFDSRSEHPTG